MRAAIFQGPRDIGVGDRPDPRIEHPTDAVVRVVLACVCGSDLWYYRGIPDLLDDVLDGAIDPGRVLDFATDLEDVATAYAAMDDRRAITSLVRVGTV